MPELANRRVHTCTANRLTFVRQRRNRVAVMAAGDRAPDRPFREDSRDRVEAVRHHCGRAAEVALVQAVTAVGHALRGLCHACE